MATENHQPTEAPAKATPRYPLRVALDVRTWEMSGLGTYLRELMAANARLRLPIQWTFIGPEAVRERLPPGLVIERWHDFEAPIYGMKSFWRYPKLGDVDLFHYPHYNMPRVRVKARLANVFDLFHIQYGSWAKRQYQKFFLRHLRWHKAHLLTASEKTRREIQQLGKVAEGRISAIPLGPGRSLTLPSRPKPPEVNSLAGTPLRPPWLMVTGIDQPHKNFDFMLSALSLYFQRRVDAPSLIWTGLSPQGCLRRGRQLPAQIRQRVALEPFMDHERFEALYSGAAALIFPSLDEGFGFPPLEAMVRGVPVICSRREPMTSILGSAPLYFEPTESASFWRMLDRLLDSPEVHEEIAERGQQRASQFSWDYTAYKTFGLYQSLIAQTQK